MSMFVFMFATNKSHVCATITWYTSACMDGPNLDSVMQVAPLHQRGVQASFRPSSPILRGSFDHLQQRQNTTPTPCTAVSFPQKSIGLPTVRREETGPDTHNQNHHHHHDHQHVQKGFPVFGGEGVEVQLLKTVALRSVSEAEEEEVDPDVRYRVRFTDAPHGPSAEGGATLPERIVQEARESPPVQVRRKKSPQLSLC